MLFCLKELGEGIPSITCACGRSSGTYRTSKGRECANRIQFGNSPTQPGAPKSRSRSHRPQPEQGDSERTDQGGGNAPSRGFRRGCPKEGRRRQFCFQPTVVFGKEDMAFLWHSRPLFCLAASRTMSEPSSAEVVPNLSVRNAITVALEEYSDVIAAGLVRSLKCGPIGCSDRMRGSC